MIHAAPIPRGPATPGPERINLRYPPHPGGDRPGAGAGRHRRKGFIQVTLRLGLKERSALYGGDRDTTRPVYKKLKGLLRYGRGTYERVFLARQAELIETLDRIKEDRESLSTLADMLRTVVFQSGGISVDELESRLTQELESLESNWEYERDGPRGGRDIDRPHRQRVGQILDSLLPGAKTTATAGRGREGGGGLRKCPEQHQRSSWPTSSWRAQRER